MTKRKVLLAGMVGFILLAMGLISRPISNQAGWDAITQWEQTTFETRDLWSQIAVLCGGSVLFCLVLLPIALTLFYPDLRDQRRRMFPQMPDEEIFEMLLIKDWKKNS